MKSINFFLILLFMVSFGHESLLAQTPQKAGYMSPEGIPSVPVGFPDTTFGMGNIPSLYLMTGRVPDWTDINGKTGFVFHKSNLLTDPILNINTSINSAQRSAYISGSGGGTFSSKWERLTGKPIIDTATLYYSPLKRTTTPSFSDNRLYRLTGNIFNFLMDTKYPSRNAPK